MRRDYRLAAIVCLGLGLGAWSHATANAGVPDDPALVAPGSVPLDDSLTGVPLDGGVTDDLDAVVDGEPGPAESEDPGVASAARAEPKVRGRVTGRVSSAAGAARTAAPAAAIASTAPARTEFDLRPLAASPVPGVESSGFGWREDPFNYRRKFHKGTDFRAPRGTAVYAAGAGVVAFAGRMGGYGKVVFIDHGDGVITRYGHLSAIGVQKGALIAAGAKLGAVGSTGRATGPHLHFEVRLDGRAVNPQVAMTVADLQRKDPRAALAAAIALAPEVQAASVDPHPRPGRRGKAAARPERRGRAKRSQVLW